MGIYLLNILLLFYWKILLHMSKINKNNLLIYIYFIQIYLLTILRSPSVGSDTFDYINFFDVTKQISFWNFRYSRFMPGYELLNKILIPIKNQQIFLAILSFIPLFLIFKFIKKYSKMPWLSIFIFITFGFFTESINLFRQYIAIGIILISYKYLINNKLFKFLLTVLFGASFHISALVFLPIYLVKNWKINFKNSLFFIFVGVFTYVFSEYLINIMIKLFSTYSYTPKHAGGEKLLLIYIFIYISGLIFYRKVKKKNYNYRILYNIIISSILIQILALDFSLLTRATNYFSIFIIIFIPEVITAINNKNIKYLGLSLIITLLFGFYIFSLNIDIHSITPYRFFWN